MNIFGKITLAFGAVMAVVIVSLVPKTAVEATACIKGTSYKDFTGTITKDSVTVKTKSGVLCNDVTLNATSFVLTNPDYNGMGWSNNPTAYPQTKYATKTAVMKAGTNGNVTITVPVPNECTNYQLDAYIGPEQTIIDSSEGLKGTNAIVGKIFNKTKSDCSPPKPVTVKACDTSAKTIVMVEKGTENTAPNTTDFTKCEEVVKVCDTTTGKIVTVPVSQADDKKYTASDDEKCNPVAPPTTTTELPTTGPEQMVTGILGIGSLAGAASMYLRSRRS